VKLELVYFDFGIDFYSQNYSPAHFFLHESI